MSWSHVAVDIVMFPLGSKVHTDSSVLPLWLVRSYTTAACHLCPGVMYVESRCDSPEPKLTAALAVLALPAVVVMQVKLVSPVPKSKILDQSLLVDVFCQNSIVIPPSYSVGKLFPES